jgi:hypothetical protein
MTHCAPSVDPVCPSKPAHPSTIMSLGPTRAPSLGAHPLPCAFSRVDHRDSLWVCRWGRPTSPVHPCCRGQMGPLLGHAPKLPCPFPNTTQVFVNRSKESKVCAPLVFAHVTIVCPRCSCSHPNVFIFPTDCFLLVLFVCSVTESAQGAHTKKLHQHCHLKCMREGMNES